jgi:Ca2+-binding RTX toxin-like protein
MHIGYLANIPIVNVLVKSFCVSKHPGIANYTDATARQYLIDTYHWTINNGVFDGSKTVQGNNNADTLNTNTLKTTLHGLGGNDTLTGGATDDILIGGAGDDTIYHNSVISKFSD